MKKPIFYTVVSKYNPRVMAVTTEKRSQLYGWWADDETSTHKARHTCWGRFPSREAAQSVISEIVEIRIREREALKPVHQEEIRIQTEATSKINAIIFKATGVQSV